MKKLLDSDAFIPAVIVTIVAEIGAMAFGATLGATYAIAAVVFVCAFWLMHVERNDG